MTAKNPFARWSPGLRWLLLTLLLLPATWPLWLPHVQATHDGLHHLARFFELDLALGSGVLYPRWFPHMGFLYGFPVLHYYAPLTYYLGEIVILLGGGVLAAFEWTLGLGLVAAGWTMYIFARRWGEKVGWLAAILYVYWPYHLSNALVRGAQAELWAMVWAPLLLAAIHDLLHAVGNNSIDADVVRGAYTGTRSTHHAPRERLAPLYRLVPGSAPARRDAIRAGLLVALSTALLMLTHNISAFFFTPFVLAYGVWEGWGLGTGDWGLGRPIRHSLFAIRHSLFPALQSLLLFWLLGLGLSAFFWLPALADVDWVRASLLREGVRLENAGLLYLLGDLISPFWLHRYLPDQGTATFDPIPRVAGLLWLLGAIAAGLAWRRNRTLAVTALFFALCTLAGVGMMHSASRPLWLDAPFVSYLGPPYRFQSLVALGGSLTVALGLGHWLAAARRGGWLAGGMVALALAVSGAVHLPQVVMTLPGSTQPLTEERMDLAAVVQFDFQIGLAARDWGSAWFYEYLPTWVEAAPTEFFLPPAQPAPVGSPLSVDIRAGDQTPLSRSFWVNSPDAWTFSLHQFYFPAWQVRVDGVPVESAPAGPLGLLSAPVPAGEHTVAVTYGATPSQRVGEGVALLAALVWLFLAWRWRKGLLAVVVIPLLGLLLVTTLAATDRLGGDVQEIRWDAPVRLGDQAALAGAALATPVVAPGGQVWLALDWLALATPQARYKVILHLEDGEGRKWAAGDAEPGFFFTPTTRWQAGQVMEDWMSLTVPADAPPGRYRLLTGMYHLETVENLPIVGGEQVGGRLLVAEVEVR